MADCESSREIFDRLDIYGDRRSALAWCDRVSGRAPLFACVAAFTATAAIENISAAGLTPYDRLFTANADLDFLVSGDHNDPVYPLPPLVAGASPVTISRAIAAELDWPIHAVDAGLAYPLSQAAIAIGYRPARCVTTGRSLDRKTVDQLFAAGQALGRQWSQTNDWLIVGECVVGGTTTALAVLTALTALGIEASDWKGSSQKQCDRDLKRRLVSQGLGAARRRGDLVEGDPASIVAAVGDPMQPVIAGIATGATVPVLLAGGTQMLAVWELARRWSGGGDFGSHVAIGTTRWVMEDSQAAALADVLNAPLLATRLNLSASRYEALRAYERGFVKEGVGAGGAAIGAALHRGWGSEEIVAAVDRLVGATIAKPATAHQ